MEVASRLSFLLGCNTNPTTSLIVLKTNLCTVPIMQDTYLQSTYFPVT